MRVFRGVFSEASTPRTTLLLLDSARLSTGAQSVAACRDTAAQLHGFAVIDDPNVHILASDARMTRSSGLVVHRDQVSEGELVVVRGALGTHAARTAIDLARAYNRLDALAVLDLALRRGTTLEQLLVELDHHTGKRGVRQAKELVLYASPLAESPMESRTRMRCIDAGLPHPEPQVLVSADGTVRRPDLGWKKWKIGLDYESLEWHTGANAASRDNPRHNWLTNLGWLMFYVGPSQVYRCPESFTDPIRRAIAHRKQASA